MESSTHSAIPVRENVRHELRELTVITAYLFVCFAAELEFKASVLQAHEAFLAPLGIAAIKAVICAKFMLLGSAFHVGGQFTKPPLILPTLSRSFAFLVLLIVLNVIEEAVVGLIHGRTIRDSVTDLLGGTWEEIIAKSAVMLLILIPYFAFRALGEVIGEQTLVQLYFSPRDHGLIGRRTREPDQRE
jgi:hypothetical protein